MLLHAEKKVYKLWILDASCQINIESKIIAPFADRIHKIVFAVIPPECLSRPPAGARGTEHHFKYLKGGRIRFRLQTTPQLDHTSGCCPVLHPRYFTKINLWNQM